jgi:hypothetical protein
VLVAPAYSVEAFRFYPSLSTTHHVVNCKYAVFTQLYSRYVLDGERCAAIACVGFTYSVSIGAF